MTEYRVRLEATAREDIESTLDWLSEHAPHKVAEWLDALEEELATLSKMPERCPLAPENGRWGPEEVRQLLFDRYPTKHRILFTIVGNDVHILQVRHGARRWMHESPDE